MDAPPIGQKLAWPGNRATTTEGSFLNSHRIHAPVASRPQGPFQFPSQPQPQPIQLPAFVPHPESAFHQPKIETEAAAQPLIHEAAFLLDIVNKLPYYAQLESNRRSMIAINESTLKLNYDLRTMCFKLQQTIGELRSGMDELRLKNKTDAASHERWVKIWTKKMELLEKKNKEQAEEIRRLKSAHRQTLGGAHIFHQQVHGGQGYT